MEDIYLDDSGNFAAAANGDVLTVSGKEYTRQAVKHELITYPGDLWTHNEYGVGLQKFIHAENTEINRSDLILLIQEKINQNPTVEAGSAKAEIISWEEHTIVIKTSFIPALEDGETDPDDEVALIITINENGFTIT